MHNGAVRSPAPCQGPNAELPLTCCECNTPGNATKGVCQACSRPTLRRMEPALMIDRGLCAQVSVLPRTRWVNTQTK